MPKQETDKKSRNEKAYSYYLEYKNKDPVKFKEGKRIAQKKYLEKKRLSKQDTPINN